MYGSRTIVWIVLLAPLLLQSGRYLTGTIYYGEYLHWSGEWATRLLILALAITPLRLVRPKAHWTRWLVSKRRDLGIATFFYSLGHAVAYLANQADLLIILRDGLTLEMLTGWIGMAVLMVLALTSNDYSVRALAGRWKLLHRFVYPGALLILAHWILTAFDPTVGYLHLTLLLVLLIPRLFTVFAR